MAKNLEITKKIEGQVWLDALEDAFQKASKKVKIDGFRKGKVPRDVFEKKYGKESLFMDAADAIIPIAYEEILKENENLEIVAQPKVDIKHIDEKGIELVFIIITKPEVILGKYKKLDVAKEKIEVTKEEINDSLDKLRNKYAENVIKEGQAELHDTVIIDFEGFVDDIAFEGGKGENYSLKLGSNSFIPGFEEQLIGVKANDETEVKVTFPEDYHSEELKGKEATFKVKVHEVKNLVLPEFTKEFFEDLAMEGVTNKEELEKMLEENIKAEKEHQAENIYLDNLLKEAAKTVKVEIPHEMIHDEIDRMLRQYEEQLKMQGISLDLYYQFTQSTEEDLKTQMHGEAENRVLYRLMLEAIAKEEKVVITDEEADKEAVELAARYDMPKDEFLKMFGGLEMIKYDLQMRKAIDIMKA